MEKPTAKKRYWAVFEGSKVLHENTYSECWKWMVRKFAKFTMGELQTAGIHLSRLK